MKREMREACVRDGTVESFRCGPYEVLRIAHAAHMSTVTLNEEKQFILAGLRLRVKHYKPRVGITK